MLRTAGNTGRGPKRRVRGGKRTSTFSVPYFFFFFSSFFPFLAIGRGSAWTLGPEVLHTLRCRSKVGPASHLPFTLLFRVQKRSPRGAEVVDKVGSNWLARNQPWMGSPVRKRICLSRPVLALRALCGFWPGLSFLVLVGIDVTKTGLAVCSLVSSLPSLWKQKRRIPRSDVLIEYSAVFMTSLLWMELDEREGPCSTKLHPL